MAVPEQTPYKEYTANGSTTSFALGFICDSKNDLIVLVDGVAPPVATWSLIGANAVFTTAPASGKKIVLQRNTAMSRTANYQSNNNSFRPETINKDIDRVWLKLQELGVADWLMKLYVDRLHQEQKEYIDQKDDELKNYLIEEIRKQGVALDQLEDYYNRLMQKLAEIALEGGWTDSVVTTWSGRTQEEENKAFITSTTADNIGSLATEIGRTAYVKGLGLYSFNGVKWEKEVGFNDWITPQDFGAKGDGVANDLPAINAMFRYVETGAAKQVYFPKGVYLLVGVGGTPLATDKIVYGPTTPCTVVCHKEAELRRGSYWGIIAFDNQNVAGTYPNNYQSNGRNMKWYGGILNGNAYNFGRNNCMSMVGCEYMQIEDVTFLAAYGTHFLDLNSSQYLNIKNCRFYTDGFKFDEQKSDADAAKEGIQLAEIRQYGNTLPIQYVNIEGCVFGTNPNNPNAVDAHDAALGNHSGTSGIIPRHITVTNCHMKGHLRAIQLAKHSDMFISNNFIENCVTGISHWSSRGDYTNGQDQWNVPTYRSEASENVVIRDNVFKNISDSVFDAISPVYSNTIQSTPAFLKNFTFENNTCINETLSTGAAMNLRWCDSFKIRGNTFYNFRRTVLMGYLKNSVIEMNVSDGVGCVEGYLAEETFDTDYADKGNTSNNILNWNIVRNHTGNPMRLTCGSGWDVNFNKFADRTTSGVGLSLSDISNSIFRENLAIGDNFTNNVNIVATCTNTRTTNNKCSNGIGLQNFSTTTVFDESGTLSIIKATIGATGCRYLNTGTGDLFTKTTAGWVKLSSVLLP